MPIDPSLLALLVCPVTRTRLIYDATSDELISDVARLAYPVRNGIPIMLIFIQLFYIFYKLKNKFIKKINFLYF